MASSTKRWYWRGVSKQIAAQYQDPGAGVFACNLTGVALVNQGALAAGCEALERGIERCLALGEAYRLTAFVIDPEVSMRMHVAFPLMDRGLADQARMHVARGMERAERIGQPIARMLAHWAGGMFGVRANERDRVARHAAALAKVVDSAMLAPARVPRCGCAAGRKRTAASRATDMHTSWKATAATRVWGCTRAVPRCSATPRTH